MSARKAAPQKRRTPPDPLTLAREDLRASQRNEILLEMLLADAYRLLLEMQRQDALRLPFPGYPPLMEKLKRLFGEHAPP